MHGLALTLLQKSTYTAALYLDFHMMYGHFVGVVRVHFYFIDSFAPRYVDGERLTAEDEKAVVEKLLAYHPNSDDKIGCGLDSIMVSSGLFNILVNIWTYP